LLHRRAAFRRYSQAGVLLEIVVGISGASGVGYGIRLLEILKEKGITTSVVMSDSARKILEIETELLPEEVESLASRVYAPGDFTAPIASGSHMFHAMVVIPCSMGTLAGIAAGTSDTLITRTADICLKERRKLILVTRETPLSLVHLKNMVSATVAGAIVLPACPAFYTRPKTVQDIEDVLVGRVLDLMGIEHRLSSRWGGNPYNR
jgi:4-hydroxy-3-polyprenylbenzoate decarboxylase